MSTAVCLRDILIVIQYRKSLLLLKKLWKIIIKKRKNFNFYINSMYKLHTDLDEIFFVSDSEAENLTKYPQKDFIFFPSINVIINKDIVVKLERVEEAINL